MKGNGVATWLLLVVAVFGVAFCVRAEAARHSEWELYRQEQKTTAQKAVESIQAKIDALQRHSADQDTYIRTFTKILEDSGYPWKKLHLAPLNSLPFSPPSPLLPTPTMH